MNRIIVANLTSEEVVEVRDYLFGFEVVAVADIANLLAEANEEYNGMIVKCCGRNVGILFEGLAFGKLYQDHQIKDFKGVVVGIACSEAHHRHYVSYGLDAGLDYLEACQILLAKLGIPG